MLEVPSLLHSREPADYLFKCPIQVHKFLEQGELHGWSPSLLCGSFCASQGGLGYCRSHSRCSSGVKNCTLGGFPSMRRRSSTIPTSRYTCTSSKVLFSNSQYRDSNRTGSCCSGRWMVLQK